MEPTPSDCSKPGNAGDLPEPVGHTHTLNTAADVFLLMYIPLLSVARGHPPPYCENTQVLREAITENGVRACLCAMLC